jgi:hypothetical protein
MYVEQWIVQFGKNRSPLLDRIYTYLCVAKREAKGRPIYLKVWDINNPDDCITRGVPSDELCQCCETKLAQMSHEGIEIYRSGQLGYINLTQDGAYCCIL